MASLSSSFMEPPQRRCNHPGRNECGSMTADRSKSTPAASSSNCSRPVRQASRSRYSLHEFATDEQLRDRRHGCPCPKCRANAPTAVAWLVFDGIEVDRAKRYAHSLEEAPQRPAELAPLEREQHDRLRRIANRVCHERGRIFVCRRRPGGSDTCRRGRGSCDVEAVAGRRARDLELVLRHVRRDVSEQGVLR